MSRVFRSAYDCQSDAVSRCVALSFPDSEGKFGRTKQSFKDECDINNIMKRFARTGVLDFAARQEPRYGDCTGLEFTESMQRVAAANTMFHELPSHIRDRFKNSPAAFLDFVNNDANRVEAEKMGLLKVKAEWQSEVEASAKKAAEDASRAAQEDRQALAAAIRGSLAQSST